MRQSETINELASALSKAQGEIIHATKDKTNPYFNSKYADLASVLDVCREPLAKNGLSVSQMPSKIDGQWILITKLMHSSGQWIEGDVPILVTKQDAQGFGSGMTYARRYGISSIVGIAQDDDDGNAATKNQFKNKEEFKKTELKQEPEKKLEPPKQQRIETPITASQQKALIDLAIDKKISPSAMKDLMKKTFSVESSSQLKKWQYEELVTNMMGEK